MITPPHDGRHGFRAGVAGSVMLALIIAPSALAGEADIVDVNVIAESAGTYSFEVTVEHADEGWEHYADRWDVLDNAGNVLGSRKLLHPHVSEQPFTRSLSGVTLPDGLTHVTIRAHDSVHGYGGKEMKVSIPAQTGQ
ncbi:hypothetical protein ACFPOD_00080 [Nitratireductor kimnyeongensis]|uniref:Uncharacterized protein n=1 Tax=Nitratireductor kimnyeongensis TaxID=430679 RepID=A0ABW0T3F5_9HYPH|nr:hypothetical protein [Nitratireductor kimnyeongensis]QZZ35441.1 hypothetical protein KW403_17115 [Nitratireductor kimnyeongensis]